VYSSAIAYKFYSSEGSTGTNQATVYGVTNSATFNVPNLPSDGSNINVIFYVDRVAPDGIAGDLGYVIWYLDGSQQDIQFFAVNDQVQKSYTMSINKNSVVVVTVQEG
jgi:sugar lactone lactonase YvrE